MKTCFLIACVLCMNTVRADETIGDWAYGYFIDGATVKLGVGTRQSGIKVTRVSDGREGHIVQRNESSYFLSYSTRPTYTSIDHIGLTFIFNLSNFDADTQEVDKDVYTDIGSRVRGEFFYVVPTIFYELGYYETGTYFRTGIGLGLGIARFRGNVFLDHDGVDEVQLDQEGSEVTAASSVFIEYYYKHIGLTINAAGPNYESDQYKYNVEDISINLGYLFIF